MTDFLKTRRQIWIGVTQFCRLEQAALRHGLTRRELADAVFEAEIDALAKRVAAKPREPRRRKREPLRGPSLRPPVE